MKCLVFAACVFAALCHSFGQEHEVIEGLAWPQEPFAIQEPVELSPLLEGRDLRTDVNVFRDAKGATDLAAQGRVKEAMQLLYWAIKRRPETYGYGDLSAMFAISNAPNTAIYWLQRCAWAEGVDVEAVEQDRNFESITSDARWPKLRDFFMAARSAWQSSKHHQEILVLPTGYQVNETLPLVLILHGQMGTPERMFPRGDNGLTAQTIADRHHVALLSVGGTIPAARYSYGWTNDLDLDYQHLMKAVDHVKDRVTPDMKRLSIIGFSRGAQEGIEIAVRHPDQFLGVLVFCPGTVAGCRLNAVSPMPDLSGKRFLIIRGDNEGDASQAVAQADADFVEKAGAKVAYQSVPGMGHSLPPNYDELVNSWVEVNFGRTTR